MTQKQLTLDASLANSEPGTEQLMLTELRKFRQESGKAPADLGRADNKGYD